MCVHVGVCDGDGVGVADSVGVEDGVEVGVGGTWYSSVRLSRRGDTSLLPVDSTARHLRSLPASPPVKIVADPSVAASHVLPPLADK